MRVHKLAEKPVWSKRFGLINNSDYSERELWPGYIEACQEALERTSTHHLPWYIIRANHKWFRNLAISQIIEDTMEIYGSETSAYTCGHGRNPQQISYCRAGAGKAEWPEWPGELGLKTSICRLPQIVEIPG